MRLILKVKTPLVILFFVLAILFVQRTPATVFRMLTGDYTTINADWSAYENGSTFATVESGSRCNL